MTSFRDMLVSNLSLKMQWKDGCFGNKVGLCLLSSLFLGLMGCGSATTTQAGPISVTDPNGIIAGQLTSLGIATSAKLSMTPRNDGTNAGVDWTVSCGGNPLTGSVGEGACGSLSTAHTSSGAATLYNAPATIPSGATVTIVAAVTGDPAATSSVTLSIISLSISVSAVTGPTSLLTGATGFYNSAALNDTTGKGVTWSVSCAQAPCGSFPPAGSNATANTYTAPSSVPTGGSVVITATSVADPTESASITVSITAPPPVGAVAITLLPSTAYVTTTGSTRSQTLTAIVTSDSANAGVTWTCILSGNKPCGTAFTSVPNTNDVDTATFQASSSTAPVGTVATITATSVTGNITAPAATINVVGSAPIVIAMTQPPPSSLGEGATATLAATATPVGQSILWAATCGGTACGTFSTNPTTSGMTTIYTAPSSIPSGGVVTITASSEATTPANSAFAETTITTPVPKVVFDQQPFVAVAAMGQTSVSAEVVNDSVPPSGVSWSVTCSATSAGGCGSIQPYQTANGATATYTAPPVIPNGPVTIVATSASTSFKPVTQNSTPITITPASPAISFVPSLPTQLPGYAVVNLNAAVSNDTTNAGVDWSVCASGCGFFTKVAAVPAIPATSTTPYVPAVPAVTATSVSAWPNGLSISYTAPAYTATAKPVSVTAAAHVNSSIKKTSSIAITNAITNPMLAGVVQAGSMPVVGATVALYAAGTSGYGSAAELLYAPQGSAYATTDSNGHFSVAAGYSCPQSNSQVYLVALGGNPGTGANNPNLAMMTALGPCSNLSSGSVTINEVTTIASAWALAPFGSNDALTGQSSYLNLGSSSSNVVGLANAFASVNNLVNIATGKAQFTVPAGNAAVPYAEINTLADILNSCTSSTGGAYDDGTPCGTLFFNAPNVGNGGPFNGSIPTDTLQAAFNIAQHPAGEFGYGTTFSAVNTLFPLAAASSPFQPILTTVPNDWSIALNFSGVGGLSATSEANFFAIDASGNLWITDSAGNRVIEWSSLGAAISPAAGFNAGGIESPGPIAVDASDNIWISGSNGLTELYNVGTPAQGSPFTGGTNGLGMAFDSLSNLWITNGNAVQEFNSVGAKLSPSNGYSSGVTATRAIAIDNSNNVWVGNGDYSLALLSDASGQVVVNTLVGGDSDPTQAQIAIDASGNVWVLAGPQQLCKMPAYGGLGSVPLDTCYSQSFPGSTGLASINNVRGIALDGAGSLWIGNAGSTTAGNLALPTLTEVSPGLLSNIGAGASDVGFNSASLASGPLLVAVDGSGNVWVLLANSTMTEYVGIATPAITPTALAVKDKKIGKTP